MQSKKEYDRKWREANRERIKDYNHKYYVSHREAEIARCAKYISEHRQHTTDKARERRRKSSVARQRANERAKQWYSEKHAHVLAQMQEYRDANRDMIDAHNAVKRAIRAGDLVRKPCEVCGEERAEAHHDDYNKPLEVRWLCKMCHRLWHAQHEAKRRL